MVNMKYRLIIATCPKPFDETFAPLQINAIKSWLALSHPNIATEIWLLGHEQGVEETAKCLNCKWSDVEYNKYGTPLVSDIFKKLQNIQNPKDQNPKDQNLKNQKMMKFR